MCSFDYRERAMRELPLRIGVSACLLGQPVRFDGGHKRDRFLTDALARHVEWVPVCPELEAGLGVPRPALRLVRRGEEIRVQEVKSGRDHTRKLESTTRRRVAALRQLGLHGFVLKKGSPSCGIQRVKVHPEQGRPRREGRGRFAEALLCALPNLPAEEEGRLGDLLLRENFIERIFAYRRLREAFAGRWTRRAVVEFHMAHELQVMAHSPGAYRELGRMVASVKDAPRAEFRERYEREFMAALSLRATPGRNANVLQRTAGYLSRQLSAESRAELAETIRDYRGGLVPLVVPLTLIRHHARSQQVDYLLGQGYLDPHPKERMLRNRV